MQFSSALLAAAILAVAKAAQFTNTAAELSNITANDPVTLTWTGAAGPVTLLLKDGPATNLQTVLTIGSKSLSRARE
jgi:hypothetical protein